jgi:hypothetical protein
VGLPVYRNVILSFIFTVILWPSCVFAQGMSLDIVNEIPNFEAELSEEEFLSNSVLRQYKPRNDRYLEYKIRLPVGWSASEGKLDTIPLDSITKKRMRDSGNDDSSGMGINAYVLETLATYNGPERFGISSFFVLKAQELDKEISVKNWFLLYSLQNGYTLKGVREISDRKMEGLYVVMEGDRSYVVRLMVEINGSRIMLAMYYLPIDFFEQERAVQQHVIRSFEFLDPEEPKGETRRDFAFLDLLRFQYPANWQIAAPNLTATDEMDVTLVNSHNEKTLRGEILFSVISTEFDTTIGDEVNYIKEDMENSPGKKNLRVGNLIEIPEKYDLSSHIYFDRVEIYEANDVWKELQDYEYWVAVMMEDRYYYIITMLTPARHEDFFVWVENSEAFKIVIESIIP